MTSIPKFQNRVKWLASSVTIAFLSSLAQIADVQEEYRLYLLIFEILALTLAAGILIVVAVDGWYLKTWPSGIPMALLVISTISYIALICWFNGYLFKRSVINAVFLDDFSSMRLRLFEDGKYVLIDDWMFGTNRYTGHYSWNGDTIKLPYPPIPGRDFIALKMLVDRKARRIYFRRKIDGSYERGFYYFEID
ncbi:hypothetical protein SAMN04487996_12021 [Dyadobacter soli]|uniref:Uncharacterized protein n=1 Tax=Dyadobacter soli TaxID=659014 RepID=A0A1G7VBC9_9BACT|nr:hypothetical protein [Dyadobacter soli]SDG56878.1 hypothetical protein SAMN04487996_12021 [Dyadobacter soli]